MPRFRHYQYQPPASLADVSDLIRLWILRILVPLGASRLFVRESDFNNDTLAEILGLGEWVDCPSKSFASKKIRQLLREIHEKAEKSKTVHMPRPETLISNLNRLSELGGLTETDCRILEFSVYLHNERMLDEAADMLGNISSSKLPQLLSIILELPERDIRLSLSGKGALVSSGLLTIERDGANELRRKINLLSSDFADTVLYSDVDPITLLKDFVSPSKPATLEFDDFRHLSHSLTVLRPYLQHVLTTHRQGVNILLYGTPGTGKSELSRLLARELNCELYEVSAQDDDGDPIDGDRRLQAYRAAQKFFSQRRALILFDEVEDVLRGGDTPFFLFSPPKRTPQASKAWVNRMLESNVVPTIWVSNSVDNVDRAVIRRFDMAIEVPVPPKRQRERIVLAAGGALLPKEMISRIAESENLAPAIITRAVSVVESIKNELREEDVPAAIERLVGNTLEAQGHKRPKSYDSNRLPSIYDPSFVNADVNLESIANGLKQSQSGRVCLYGPPGTGKTAFGRWLSDKFGLPLSVKRGSDLLSMYVGGTEANIAEAFREAEQDGAILMIDEVDSFLRDRRQAQRSWEVTGVNEMLTQMEGFSGIFIASTNLMDGLDQAALRRFDLKVCFGFLSSSQAWLLFKRHCKAMGLPTPKAGLKVELDKFPVLTPGDFAAVARQNRFHPIKNPAAMLDALKKECGVKEEGRRKSIGFC